MKVADDREKDGGTDGTGAEGALDDDGGSSPPPPPDEGGVGTATPPNDMFIVPRKEHRDEKSLNLHYLWLV